MGGLKTWGRRFAQSAPMWLKTALMTRHYTECVGRASARTLLLKPKAVSFPTPRLAIESKWGVEQGHEGELRHWDVAFWAERLREAKYNIKDEQLRPYFALPNVLNGLFQVPASPARPLPCHLQCMCHLSRTTRGPFRIRGVSAMIRRCKQNG